MKIELTVYPYDVTFSYAVKDKSVLQLLNRKKQKIKTKQLALKYVEYIFFVF